MRHDVRRESRARVCAQAGAAMRALARAPTAARSRTVLCLERRAPPTPRRSRVSSSLQQTPGARACLMRARGPGQSLAGEKLLEWLGNVPRGAGSGYRKCLYACRQVQQLFRQLEKLPQGDVKKDLEERAMFMACTLLVHVYGRAHETEHDAWKREPGGKHVKAVEALVPETELQESFAKLFSDKLLTCGVFSDGSMKIGLVVEFTAGVTGVAKFVSSSDGKELGALYSPRSLWQLAGELLREQQPYFKTTFPELDEDEKRGLPDSCVQLKQSTSWSDVCHTVAMDSRGSHGPSLRAELYSRMHGAVSTLSQVKVKLRCLESAAAYAKRTASKSWHVRKNCVRKKDGEQELAVAKRTASKSWHCSQKRATRSGSCCFAVRLPFLRLSPMRLSHRQTVPRGTLRLNCTSNHAHALARRVPRRWPPGFLHQFLRLSISLPVNEIIGPHLFSADSSPVLRKRLQMR